MGLSSNIDSLSNFIYDDLNTRLGCKTAHIRKIPFIKSQVRNTNATKKGIKRIVQKLPVKQIIS